MVSDTQKNIIYDNIVAAVNAQEGHLAEMVNKHLRVDGESMDWALSIKPIWERAGFRSMRSTNKLVVTAGGNNDRQAYQQRKDGTFHYENIATKLINAAEAQRLWAEQRRNRDEATPIVEALRKRLKISQWGTSGLTLEPSTYPDMPVILSYKCHGIMGESDAERVVLALRAAGLVGEDK